ncbi:hypothetical protein FRC10_006615 [Ceratobasidium sp. 414]|nr:hypothetical protein FRC10_006615 [Ceratobasidium sp. 414]
MSLLANLLHGHGAFELDHCHDVNKESKLSKTQSQTTTATLYNIVTSDGRRFNVLDTPGLADTRGIDQDKTHKAEINSAIQQHVQSIDAVIIMVNGTIQRLNVATDYALNVICSMFPRTIIANIGFMFTNSTPMTSNFDHEGLPPELRESQSWTIQNPLALLKNHQRLVAATPVSPVQERNRAAQLQGCYEETVETLNEWLVWLDSRQVQSTIEIDRLYRISTDIESNIESALATITRLSELRARYQSIELDLQHPDRARGALKALKELETEKHWDRQPTDQPNTICIAPGCYSNCHAPCYMRLTEDYTSLGRWCKVFKNWGPLPVWDGAAAVCKIKSCQHPSSMHRHYPQIHYLKARVTDPEKRAEVSNATTEAEQIQVAKTIIVPEKLTEINQEIASAQDNIPTLVEQYNEKSLSRNFAGHIRSAIQMLKLRKEELNTKSNTNAELQLIDESISKFEWQLALLTPVETNVEAGVVFHTVLPGGFPPDFNRPVTPPV